MIDENGHALFPHTLTPISNLPAVGITAGEETYAIASRYLSIINHQLDLVCRYSPEFMVTFVNDAFCHFFGRAPDKLLGISLFSLYRAVEPELFCQHVRQLTPDAPYIVTERHAVAHTGADHWQQWCDRAVFDDCGRIVEYQAVGRDITNQNNMEVQLHEREERYRAIVSNAAMGICLVDAYGQFLECNPAFVQMSGNLPEELSMLTLAQVTCPEDWEEERGLFQRLWENNSTGYSLEKRLLTKDNRLIWTQAMTTLIRDPHNEPQYVVQLLEDISVRKEAERIRSEYADRLRALSLNATLAEERERRRIAQNLHDQIGQMLAIARMQLGKICASAGVKDTDLQQNLEETRTLLSEALDYSRTVTCELSPPILHELGLVPALRWLARHFSDRYHLPTNLSVDGAIPKLAQEERVVLYHTARELLFNVVKHAQASQAQLVIGLDDGGMVALMVEDDGDGFPRPAGTAGSEGFGLFSVRERVGQMGGSLDIETGSWGTRCRVCLPVP